MHSYAMSGFFYLKKMECKQTAVDYLLHKMSELIGIIAPNAFSALLLKEAHKQAKLIEEVQIRNAYNQGMLDQLDRSTSPNSGKYYRENYGSI